MKMSSFENSRREKVEVSHICLTIVDVGAAYKDTAKRIPSLARSNSQYAAFPSTAVGKT